MANSDWIPRYIKRNYNFAVGEKLTAQELNAILNLLVSTSDYNSSWLKYLVDHGITEAATSIDPDTMKNIIQAAVEEWINTNLGGVLRQTPKYLNSPKVCIVSTSGLAADVTTGLALFPPVTGIGNWSQCVTPGLVGQNVAYPTLYQLTTLKATGVSLVAEGYMASDVTVMTEAQLQEEMQRCKTWYATNNYENNIRRMFDTIAPSASSRSKAAAELMAEYSGVSLYAADEFGYNEAPSWLDNNYIPRVLSYSKLTDLADNSETFEAMIAANGFIVLGVDLQNDSSVAIAAALDMLAEKDSIIYLSLSGLIDELDSMIAQSLSTFKIDSLNADGVSGEELYIHWEQPAGNWNTVQLDTVLNISSSVIANTAAIAAETSARESADLAVASAAAADTAVVQAALDTFETTATAALSTLETNISTAASKVGAAAAPSTGNSYIVGTTPADTPQVSYTTAAYVDADGLLHDEGKPFCRVDSFNVGTGVLKLTV